MARRSTVVSPPPSPRRTSVLRAGPPKQRGRVGDRVAGVLGVLFLLLAVYMVSALPEEDVVLPQFRVSFTTQDAVQLPSQTTDMIAEGAQWDAPFEVDADNVFGITVTVEYEDDQASSTPDMFTLRLLDPDGEQVGEDVRLVTADPQRRSRDDLQNTTGPSDTYVSERKRQTLAFPIIQRPTDLVVEGESEDDTLDAVAERLLPDYQIATQGTWTVQVVLDEAGGCPAPSEDPDVALQSAVCNEELQPSGRDPGNGFSVTLFSYTAYTADVIPLDV